MILDKYVNIRWNQNNKKYYIKHGYVFTKFGELFNVNINDLSNSSHVMVNVKCDVCEKKRQIIYREYYSNIQNCNYYSCSRKCGINKKINTVLKKYGVENVSQCDVIKEKKLQTNINNYGEIYMKYFPKFNLNSITYLDIISKKLNLIILHALNGGEKKFVRYYVDGYIPEYNICIEWDEKQHNVKRKKDRDNKKDEFLIKNFNCLIIRINEKDFLNDNNQINIIVNSIKNIIKEKHGGSI